ncbi:KH domain-containing protein [Streptococcaceae bacterium ESL0687]|nr:KH domain-containing protein [Streptococcaceae bacterium ESL0687]
MESDIQNLVLRIVTPLLSKPEEIRLELVDADEFLEYHLHIAEADMGRIIGKQGRIIQAIRTIVYSVPVDGKKIRLLVNQ